MVANPGLGPGGSSLVTFVFSETVTDFTLADLTADSGVLSDLATSDGGLTWTATLTAAPGIEAPTNFISLDLADVLAGGVPPGSWTVLSNPYSVDTAGPTASVVVADTTLAPGETSLVTITFSEAVSGLDNADLTVADGTLSSVSSSDGGITWTATLTAGSTPGATNVITLDNTGVTDAVGNAGAGTTDSNNYVVGAAAPTATIVVADTALTLGETSAVTFTFSEAVTGFTNADLTVEGGTLSSVSSGDGGVTWTATFTPTSSFTDDANHITLDNTGVANLSSISGSGTTDSNNYAIDTARPTVVSIVVADPALTTGETSAVTFTFSEAVTGFTSADVTVDHGALSGLSSADGGVTWTATLTPDVPVDDATNVITLANSGVTDVAGNAGAGTTTSANYTVLTETPAPPPPSPPPSVTITVPTGGGEVLGTDGGDTFIVNLVDDVGTATIFAGAGSDIVQGATNTGSLTVFGGTGFDTIVSGFGNDILQGNQGSDSIIGGFGNDLVYGGLDNDTVFGGVGADSVIGGMGNDVIQANADDDSAFGGDGADIVIGGKGNDTIQGNAGSDTVAGDLGDDVVRGGQGDDALLGGDGSDDLWGDAGADTMFGGAGADRFHGGGTGTDIIGDFDIAQGDKIVLDAGTRYTLRDAGPSTVIELEGGGQVMLAGVKLSSLTGDWLVVA